MKYPSRDNLQIIKIFHSLLDNTPVFYINELMNNEPKLL